MLSKFKQKTIKETSNDDAHSSNMTKAQPSETNLGQPKKPFVPPYREGSVTDKRRSVLHEGIKIEGNWASDGVVEFGGTINGDLTADILVVTKTGKITGTIRADQVMIEGHVSGHIYAKSLSLKPTAHVDADITTPSLSIDLGAAFNGKITMQPQRNLI